MKLKNPQLDIIRIQDVEIGADDPRVLELAARENRILLTHDVKTITKYAYERVQTGKNMPGVIEVNISASIGKIIGDLLLLASCSEDNEWEGQVIYLPW